MKMQQRSRPAALVGILALVSLGLLYIAFSHRWGQEVPPLTWSRDDTHTLLPWTIEGSAEGVVEEGTGRDHIKSPLYVFWREELMEFVWVMDHMLAKVGRPLKCAPNLHCSFFYSSCHLVTRTFFAHHQGCFLSR